MAPCDSCCTALLVRAQKSTQRAAAVQLQLLAACGFGPVGLDAHVEVFAKAVAEAAGELVTPALRHDLVRVEELWLGLCSERRRGRMACADGRERDR